MVIVLASIRIANGERNAFLEIFNANVPLVREEQGCIEYLPAIDIETGLKAQALDEDVVTVMEKWESVEALKLHLTAPHMLSYREKVKDLVQDVSLKVLRQA